MRNFGQLRTLVTLYSDCNYLLHVDLHKGKGLFLICTIPFRVCFAWFACFRGRSHPLCQADCPDDVGWMIAGQMITITWERYRTFQIWAMTESVMNIHAVILSLPTRYGSSALHKHFHFALSLAHCNQVLPSLNKAYTYIHTYVRTYIHTYIAPSTSFLSSPFWQCPPITTWVFF